MSIKANQEGVGKVYRSGSRRKTEEEEEETEEMRIDKELSSSALASGGRQDGCRGRSTRPNMVIRTPALSYFL